MFDRDNNSETREQLQRLTAIKKHLSTLKESAAGEQAEILAAAIAENERLIIEAKATRNTSYMTKNKPLQLKKVIYADPKQRLKNMTATDTKAPSGDRLAIYSKNGLIKDKKHLTLIEIAHHLGSHADAVQLQKYARRGFFGQSLKIKGQNRYSAEAVNQVILNGMNESQKMAAGLGGVPLVTPSNTNNEPVKLV